MRVAELIIASCVIVSSGAGMISARFVSPFDTARRFEGESTAQTQEADRTAVASSERDARTPGTPSPAHEPPSAREVLAGASPPAIPTLGTAAAGWNQPAALLRAAALPALSTEPAAGIPPSDQPAASSGQEGVQGGPASSTPAASPSENGPAPNQPAAAPAEPPVVVPPRVLITVDKATQRMRVTVDGKLRYTWPVSTGRAHHETPSGTYKPLWLERLHRSREWDNAPMPHSIFFTGRGHAIHATNATGRLGQRASHGCVRLAPRTAAALFALIQKEGRDTTRVTITSSAPARKTVRSRTAYMRARR
jgi:lipoprotein-anchoring transpeptidase ErfK/SrfK